MCAYVQWELDLDLNEARETIISSILLFSHFYIISMKRIHLEALLRLNAVNVIHSALSWVLCRC